jgi:hypothetical protein
MKAEPKTAGFTTPRQVTAHPPLVPRLLASVALGSVAHCSRLCRSHEVSGRMLPPLVRVVGTDNTPYNVEFLAVTVRA